MSDEGAETVQHSNRGWISLSNQHTSNMNKEVHWTVDKLWQMTSCESESITRFVVRLLLRSKQKIRCDDYIAFELILTTTTTTP